MSGQHGRARVPLPAAADLAAMVRDGETARALAEVFGCHEAAIGGRLRAAGWNVRTGQPETYYQTPTRPDHVNGSEGHRVLPWDIPEWYADASCAQTDPDLFFPEKGGSTKAAKKVCRTCTVRTECLLLALKNVERFGIWGGLSERERRKLLASDAA